MTESKTQKTWVRFTILIYFLLPLLYFLYKFKFDTNLNLTEIFWALKNSILQASAAAAISASIGLVLSLGLFNLPHSWRDDFKKGLLLPQILPAFFSVLIVFSIINPFPKGNFGITLLFVVMNTGLAAVLLHNAILTKIGNLAVVAEVFSISRFVFFKQIFIPLLIKDIINVFFLIFVFCISSFSIPIIAGDGRGINLEILVYEKIFIETNWAAAFNISAIQSVLIFCVSYFLINQKNNEIKIFKAGRYLHSNIGLFCTLSFLLLYVGGYFLGLAKSFYYFDFLNQYRDEISGALAYTFKSLFLYVIFSCLLLWLWLVDYLNYKKITVAANLFSMSTIVVGFSFYLFFPTSSDYDLIKLILAISILSFPTLFKLFLQGPIEALTHQLLIAEVYGLSNTTVIVEIIFCQLRKQFALWLAVLSVWFASDYAVSRAIGLQTKTLGLISESFLNSYRLPVAYLMSLLILVCVGIFLLLFNFLIKVIYVGYKKIAL